jgi:glucosamine--fructose-6-phosphate aminotransferase (isomerizing)
MCGIVAVIGNKNPAEIILSGLKKLEYRGYDSAGVAMLENGEFNIIREEGKILNLENLLREKSAEKTFNSHIGIGHTRWATHGRPSRENAHPHASAKVCVVHNGIIENYKELKEKLSHLGATFSSQTDTETIPHLIEHYLEQTKDIKKALISFSNDVRGTFALAVIFKDHPDVIAVAKRGSPLVLGLGEKENFVGSDYYALSEQTNKIVHLDDEEFALVHADHVEIFDRNGVTLKKKVKVMEAEKSKVSKEGYDHFMLKEIFEQPRVLEETIQTYVDLSSNVIHLPHFGFDVKAINKITIIACGTSYYAGLCAKYLIEKIAKIEVEVDIASEFRYRSHPFRSDNLMVFVSQSGETADSLAALKFAKQNNQKILSIVNAPHSSMAQLSDGVIRTVAGPEIGVASTKAYTAQVAVLAILAIFFAEEKGKISKEEKAKLLRELAECELKMGHLFAANDVKNIKKIAKSLTRAKSMLFIGRGISQITAFEAALKMRELSYINAQGIAAGELKHGTIALIDKKMPVIVIAPQNEIFEKTFSNAEEVAARGGKIIAISGKDALKKFGKMSKRKIEMPEISGMIQEALLAVIPTQLLSYYVSLFKGNDVDQPRNLAKSVTVE